MREVTQQRETFLVKTEEQQSMVFVFKAVTEEEYDACPGKKKKGSYRKLDETCANDVCNLLDQGTQYPLPHLIF